MFKIEEYIIYGMMGVCQVTDIVKESNRDNLLREYYVLDPVYAKNTLVKIPVDNDKIPMRKILSIEDVHLLIDDMPNRATLWIDDEKARNQEFKLMLRSGICDNLVTLMKSIYLNKAHKISIGKKLNKVDEEIMQTAEKLLNEEFATILNICPSEVSSYISSYGNKKVSIQG